MKPIKNQVSYDADEKKPFPMHERVKTAHAVAIANTLQGENDSRNMAAYDARVMARKAQDAGLHGKK